jgi:hypothetical protein
MDEAIRAGFRQILWMDSSLAPIAPIAPLWKTIMEQGWYAAPQFNGITVTQSWRHWASNSQATLAEWCSDKALGVFGISRVMARRVPLVLTGLVGLDLTNPLACHIWQLHKAFYTQGVFNGPHANVPGKAMTAIGRKFEGHVSADPSVLGHRHDETSLSFILYALGLRATKMGFLTLESEGGFIAQFAERFGVTYKGVAA